MNRNSPRAVSTLRASPLRGSVQIAAQFVERARSFGLDTPAKLKRPPFWGGLFSLDGAPDTIRTCDRLVRSQVLYPAELQAREGGYYKDEVYMSQGLIAFRGGWKGRINSDPRARNWGLGYNGIEVHDIATGYLVFLYAFFGCAGFSGGLDLKP